MRYWEIKYLNFVPLLQIFNGAFIDSKWLIGKIDSIYPLFQCPQDEPFYQLAFFMMGTGAGLGCDAANVSTRHGIDNDTEVTQETFLVDSHLPFMEWLSG